MQLRPYIAIDLGSDTVRAKGPAGTFSCSSVITRSADGETVTAVGEAAEEKKLKDREMQVRPIRSGVISNHSGAQALIAKAITAVSSWWSLLRPIVIIARSQLASEAKTQQLRQAAHSAGAYSVYTADVCAVAALGAGVEVKDSSAHLVVDCGAGSCEAAAVVRGNPIVSQSMSVGGFDLIDQVAQYINSQLTGTATRSDARRVLENIGSALPKDSPDSVRISASDGNSVTVNTNHVVEAIESELADIAGMIQSLMQRLPAALLADVSGNGVLLSGGLARLDNFKKYLHRRLSVPVATADRPREMVIAGAWQARQFVPEYQRHVQYAASHNYPHPYD